MYIETLFAQALIWQTSFTPWVESSGPPVLSAPYGLKSVIAASSMFCRFWHGWSAHCASAGIGRKQKHNTEIAWTAVLLNLIPLLKSGRESGCVGGRGGSVPTLEVCTASVALSTRQICQRDQE